MKIALIYDRVNKIGGAERILTALAEMYPEAPLYTLVYDKRRAPWASKFEIHTSFLQKLPFAKTYHEFFPVLPVFAFEQLSLNAFDLVISVTSTEAKGIVTTDSTLHISYILTPTRYLWSHYWEYFQNKLLRYLSLPVVALLRLWDYAAAQRPDTLVTISQTSARRIFKYYKRKAQVIYPPVDTKKFVVGSRQLADKLENSYFLVVSRLVGYKRIEIAIAACNRLSLPLKIVGSGLAEMKLKKLAGPTIEFLGNLTDTELTLYYQNCRALLFPQEEDFGITAIEALACGKPVIAYRGGGATEFIKPGVTGELFYPQTVEALEGALEKFKQKTYSREFLRNQALKFSKERFKDQFKSLIEEEWERFRRFKSI